MQISGKCKVEPNYIDTTGAACFSVRFMDQVGKIHELSVPMERKFPEPMTTEKLAAAFKRMTRELEKI